MFLHRVARVSPFFALALLLLSLGRGDSGATGPSAGEDARRVAEVDPASAEGDAQQRATPADPPPVVGGPRRVTVGLYATAVPAIDIKAGTFTIDMYMWMVHQGDGAVEEFEIANGEIVSKTLLERTTRGGRTYCCWRIKALMYEHFSLVDYPFDRQRLSIRIEHGSLETDALIFDPDLPSYEISGVPRERWGLRGDVAIPEYDIVATDWRVEQSVYQTNFGNPFIDKTRSLYSSAVFSIDVARSFWPYCYKIIIPLFVILAIAYLVFFLPPNEIQTASGLAMTSLLTCVAMNLTVSSNLPEVGYLVASDKFFICTYVLIFLTLAETVATFALARNGEHERAARIDLRFRWGFPAAIAVAFAYMGLAALT